MGTCVHMQIGIELCVCWYYHTGCMVVFAACSLWWLGALCDVLCSVPSVLPPLRSGHPSSASARGARPCACRAEETAMARLSGRIQCTGSAAAV